MVNPIVALALATHKRPNQPIHEDNHCLKTPALDLAVTESACQLR